MAVRKLKDRGEKRLYVIVAGTVQVPATVVQPIGRQAAQACHAVGLFRWVQGANRLPMETHSAITTIILQVRDSAELIHVQKLLVKKKIDIRTFVDSNPEYGALQQAVTAFCTEPVYKDQVEGILDYLPLFGCGGLNDRAIKRSDIDRTNR